MFEFMLALILGVVCTYLTLLMLGAAVGEFKSSQYGSGALLLTLAVMCGTISFASYAGSREAYAEHQKERLDPNYNKEKVHRLVCTMDGEVSFASAYGDGYRGRDNTTYTLPDGKVYVMRPGEMCGWQFSYR